MSRAIKGKECFLSFIEPPILKIKNVGRSFFVNTYYQSKYFLNGNNIFYLLEVMYMSQLNKNKRKDDFRSIKNNLKSYLKGIF
jgi:hypothetical protein